MGNKVSLLDMEFKNFTIEEKKAALVIMDVMLKKLHEKGYMVTSFSPNNISYQDGIYLFDVVAPISPMVADDRETAIFSNLIEMSVLALWVYNSNSSDYLMDSFFVSNHFDSLAFWYPEEDRPYYKSILVDSYRARKIVAPTPYFSDYVVKQYRQNGQHSNQGNSSSLAYVKATEIGKAFANREESGFGYHFFFLTIIASCMIAFVGFLFYFITYFS